MSFAMWMIKKQMKKYKVTHETFSVESLRESAKAATAMKPLKTVSFEEKEYNGIIVDVATPNKITTDNIIVYYHGGCMVSGDPRYSRSYTSYLAEEFGGQVYGVVYNLAPENKFPGPIEDCMNAFCGIKEEHPDSKMIMVGESGGAYLSLATAVMLKNRGKDLPDAIVANHPLVDWTEALNRSNFDDDIVVDYRTIPDMRDNLCRDGEDYANPELSPIYADWTGFPPVRVIWDESECLTPDCLALIEKAQNEGVSVEKKIWKGTYHCFELSPAVLPEAKAEIKDSVAFIKRVTE